MHHRQDSVKSVTRPTTHAGLPCNHSVTPKQAQYPKTSVDSWQICIIKHPRKNIVIQMIPGALCKTPKHDSFCMQSRRIKNNAKCCKDKNHPCDTPLIDVKIVLDSANPPILAY